MLARLGPPALTANWLTVADGQETIVHVYTCGARRGTPGQINDPTAAVTPRDLRFTLP